MATKTATAPSNNGKVLCQAVTRSGQPCHNGACGEGGYVVCRVHREAHVSNGSNNNGRVTSIDTKQTTVVKQEETEISIQSKNKNGRGKRNKREQTDDNESSSSSSSSDSDSSSESDSDEAKASKQKRKAKNSKLDEDDGESCQEVMCKLGIRDSDDYNDWLDVTRNMDNKLTRKVKSCVDKKKFCGLRSDMIDAERRFKRGVVSICEDIMNTHNIESITDLRDWLKENQKVAPELAYQIEQCAMRGKFKKRSSG